MTIEELFREIQETPRDMYSTLTTAILFVPEAHKLRTRLENILYFVMSETSELKKMHYERIPHVLEEFFEEDQSTWPTWGKVVIGIFLAKNFIGN